MAAVIREFLDRPGALVQDASAPEKLVPAQPLLNAPMRRRGGLVSSLHSGAPDQQRRAHYLPLGNPPVPVAGDSEVLAREDAATRVAHGRRRRALVPVDPDPVARPIGGDRRRSPALSYCLPSPAPLGVLFVASSADNIPVGAPGREGCRGFCQVRPNASKAPTEVDTFRARTPVPGYPGRDLRLVRPRSAFDATQAVTHADPAITTPGSEPSALAISSPGLSSPVTTRERQLPAGRPCANFSPQPVADSTNDCAENH